MTKRMMITVLALAVLVSGCASSGAGRALEAAEDRVEQKLDRAEDSLETVLRAAPAEQQTQSATDPTDATKPAAAAASQTTTEKETFLTPEEAERIALERAGITADQAERLKTEFEFDDGVPQYDVEFHQGRQEYEFEIHAQNGNILSFDKDRDD